MFAEDSPHEPDELIEGLAKLRDGRARSRLLRRHAHRWSPTLVDELYAQVVRLARSDVRAADRLAAAARHVAEAVGDGRSRAQALRAAGHVCAGRGKHAEALKHFRVAAKIFRRGSHDVDLARTLNGAIQSFNPLGRYDEALRAAAEARKIFERHDNALGVARLDTNVGNIYFRQDRFDEALTLYSRAYERLARIGEPQDVAAALSNLAMAYTSLNDFENAEHTYVQARAYCQRHGMPLLVVQADFNVAYLYYLRGEYTRAMELYRAVQEHSDRLGDTYHTALCDLDRSEMYLELNLNDDAGEQSARARTLFERLGIRYEAAKSITNLAIATSRQGDIARARQLFGDARRLFAREHNEVWLALVNYYEALVLYRHGDLAAARRLCESALKRFSRAAVPGKTALSQLLLARIELDAGALDRAQRACVAALTTLARAATPILSYHAHFVLGLVREAQGDRDGAYGAFRKADEGIEQLRTQLHADEQKVAFLKDKMAVYESLVATCLAPPAGMEQEHAAFGYIEKAKSRGLADLIAFRATGLTPRVTGAAAEQVRKLRKQLHWHYRHLELEEMARERPPQRLERLRQRTRALERQLTTSLDEARTVDQEFSAMHSGMAAAVDEIRAALPADTTLVEYYQARGRYYAGVLTRDRLDLVPLCSDAELRPRLRLLQFQLSKFRLGPAYVAEFAAPLLAAARSHLSELYDVLIAPLRNRLDARHLVIVPHDVLHGVPFTALCAGTRYLVDDFTISLAPSASVYRLCRTKPAGSGRRALVMGVPDALAPFIEEEVAAVARVLPQSRLFVGGDATAEQLRAHSADSRFVHIATHGHYRRDNPMFSSIKLGDGPLGVYDLYELRLSAELVTLSGCSTGRATVVGGDELLGLVRGLLYAGARGVLLTLWDAYDRTAAEFMKTFYGALRSGMTKAQASQHAMWELRQRYPHPYYWAPFALIGDVERP